MFLQKNDLVLRPARAEDAKLLSAWWSDGRIMAHAGFPDGLDMDPRTLAKDLEKDSDHMGRRLIIENKCTAIGEMSYGRVGETTAEIGIKICNFDQQDRGLGTMCLELLRDYLLYDLDYEKIILDTNLTNKRAQHVYEKLGFIKEKKVLGKTKEVWIKVQSTTIIRKVKMMKAKINLLTLWSENIERMKAFYTEILGFKIKTDLGDYIEFFNDGVRFSICKPSVMKDFHEDYKKEAYGQKLELAFECDSRQDLDQTYEDFKRKGVTCIQAPTDMPWQQRTALFADPQGNIHELFIEL